MGMDLKKLAGVVSEYAPEVGTLIGGPIGGAFGGLFSAVASLFGIHPEKAKKDPEKLIKAIQSDPEAAMKFEKFRMDNQVEIQKLLLQHDQMYLQDRQNARSRQIESERVLGKRDINLYVLAWTFVIGFFVSIVMMVILMFANQVPKNVPQYIIFLIGNLFGTLSAGVMAIIQYFFGSSKGSKEKDEWLAQTRSLTSGK